MVLIYLRQAAALDFSMLTAFSTSNSGRFSLTAALLLINSQAQPTPPIPTIRR